MRKGVIILDIIGEIRLGVTNISLSVMKIIFVILGLPLVSNQVNYFLNKRRSIMAPWMVHGIWFLSGWIVAGWLYH